MFIKLFACLAKSYQKGQHGAVAKVSTLQFLLCYQDMQTIDNCLLERFDTMYQTSQDLMSENTPTLKSYPVDTLTKAIQLRNKGTRELTPIQ